MAYLDSENVSDLVADIKALADQTYLTSVEAGDVTYNSSATYSSGTVGYGIKEAYDYAESAYYGVDNAMGLIAQLYGVTRSYTVGNICLLNGLLYQCTQNTPTPAGEFDSSYWTRVRVEDLLGQQNNAISGLQTTINGFGSIVSFSVVEVTS